MADKDTMKIARNKAFGDLDQIEIAEASIPSLSPREVLVKVKAAGLNPKDVLVRKGKFKRFTGSRFPQGIIRSIYYNSAEPSRRSS